MSTQPDAPLLNWASLNKDAKKVHQQAHPFHLVIESPLPFLVSMALGAVLCMSAFFFHDWPVNDILTLASIGYYVGKPYYFFY